MVDNAREAMAALVRQSKALGAKEALEITQQQSLGHRNLTWLLNGTQSSRFVVGLDTVYLGLLAHLMIAESVEDHLWTWLHQQCAALEIKGSTVSREARLDHSNWSSRLIASIIAAQLARDVNHSADEGIRTVLKLQDLRQRFRSATVVGIRASTIPVSHAITTQRYRNTSPGLYDVFLRSNYGGSGLKDWEKRLWQYHPQVQLEMGTLLLYHPKDPNSDVLLRVLRHREHDTSHRIWHPKTTSEAAYL